MTNIRPLEPADRDVWFRLWKEYYGFYETKVPDEVSEETYRRLLDGASSLFCLVAEDPSGAVIGFTNCVLHANTWSQRDVCYLEDLFVDSAARGRGVGRALIDGVTAKARQQGWLRVYWKTHANATARTLYDRINPVTDWVVYEVDT